MTALASRSVAPGVPLWGEPARPQPIAPLVLMAALLLLVATPTALAGSGGSGNPIHIMQQIATSTWELTGLIQQSNESLTQIERHTRELKTMQANLGVIAESSTSLAASTSQLDGSLAEVASSVSSSKTSLTGVEMKIEDTATDMQSLRGSVTGSARSTKAVVNEFNRIDSAIASMDSSLEVVITKMARSAPLTASFANNRTRLLVAGGDPTRYKVPNLAPNNRVMTIALGMLATMQKGGMLPARKDSHVASNPVIGAALRLKVPNGTNVAADVEPFDAREGYGLPPANFFVNHRIHGF